MNTYVLKCRFVNPRGNDYYVEKMVKLRSLEAALTKVKMTQHPNQFQEVVKKEVFGWDEPVFS